MKKYVPIFLSLLLLTSCTNNNLNIENSDGQKSPVVLNHTSFENKIVEKTDFIFLISLSTCLTCHEVLGILGEYMVDNNKLLYTIELSEYSLIDSAIFSYEIDRTPLLVFIKEGRVVDERQKNLTDKSEVYNLINSKIETAN